MKKNNNFVTIFVPLVMFYFLIFGDMLQKATMLFFCIILFFMTITNKA